MGNALFVVWRESLEALLIVSILHAWLKQNDPQGDGRRSLWFGVAAGIASAMLLAWLMIVVQSALAGEALEWFQTAMIFLAVILITHMVLWMQRHGRHMKRELQSGIAAASKRAGSLGIFLIALLAIAREGTETAVFLYGISLEEGFLPLLLGSGLGLGLACVTAWLIEKGLGLLNVSQFFRVTGLLLFLFAAALLVTGVERLVGMGWLPTLVDPVWDTRLLFDDSSAPGRIVANLTGYRSQPPLTVLLVYVFYWLGVLWVSRMRRAD